MLSWQVHFYPFLTAFMCPLNNNIVVLNKFLILVFCSMVCRCIFPLFTFVPVVYRMDEFALIGTSSESTSKSVSLDGARRMALKRIEAFVLTFSDPQTFAAAAASSAPAPLSQITESARIPEAGHLRCRFSLCLLLVSETLPVYFDVEWWVKPPS